MKKNKLMTIASLMLVLVLVTTCFVGGTFAKYTSTSVASDTVTVAKWDVKLDGTSFTDTTTFNFTETWKDSDGTSEESDVVSERLAPGTKGSFDLAVTNSSEVNAKFNIDFDFAALSGLPLEFTYKVGEDIYTDASFVNIAMNETKTVTVTWEWPFERTDKDAEDTTFGKAGSTFNVSATITVQQVD